MAIFFDSFWNKRSKYELALNEERRTVMATEKQIRIIKRAERHEGHATPTQTKRDRVGNSKNGAKHDAVTVITGWVSELRQKKVAETARGFESLFSQSAAGATRG